jgi:hypothetical protein
MCLKSIQYPAHQSRWIQLEHPYGWRLATIWVCTENIREAECLSITKVILQVPEYNRKDVHITTREEMKNYQL